MSRNEEPGGRNTKTCRTSRQRSRRSRKVDPSHSQARLAALGAILEGLSDGLLTLDTDWRFTYLNEAAAAVLKSPPGRLLGKVIWESVPSLRDSRFHDAFLRAAREDTFVRFEDYYEPLNRWYECRCHPTPEGLAVFLSDATGNRKIEETFLESRQALEMAIAGSSAGIWRLDLNPEKPGVIPDYLYLSPQLKALLGFASEEFPNSQSAWYDRILPEDRPRVEEAIGAHANGQSEICQVDFRIRHKDGGIRWLSRRGKLYRDELNRPLRWTGVDTDITDRKHAERTMERLKEQAERAAEQARWLARIPEESPDPILRISNEHVMLYSNPAARELCEYWSCWVGQKVPLVVQEIISETLAAGTVTHHELLCGDRTFHLMVAPCPAESYVNVFAQDITERKHAEETLQETHEQLQRQAVRLRAVNEELRVQREELRSQQEVLQSQAKELRDSEQALRRLNEELEQRVAERTADLSKANEALRQAGAYNRSLIEASLDPLVTIGPDGRITDVSRATEEVTGRSRAALIGTDFSNYFTEPARAAEGYRRVFREGSVHDYPLEIRHQDGCVTPVLYNATVYRDDAGQVTGVFAAARDVTELRRAEQGRSRLAAIVECSEDAIIGKDLNGTVTSWNRGAQKLYGYAAEEILGKSISLLAPSESREEVEHLLERMRHNEQVEHFETVRITKDGRPVHVSLTISPIRDASGRVAGAATITRDITARKQAQEALNAERQRFNDVLETLPAYLVLLTPDYHVPFANRFFRERFGESYGKRCFEYLFNRTGPCEICDTYKTLKTNAPQRWEWTGPDGHIYDIYDFPFTDTDGSPLIMEMGIDITERKKAEAALKEANETLEQRVQERTAALQEANERLQTQAEELQTQTEELQTQQEELQAQTQELRESEERYRGLFNGMTEGFGLHEMIFDSEGCPCDYRFLEVNPAFERLTGLKRRDILGRTVREVIPNNDPFWVETYGRVVLTGEPVHFEQYNTPLNRWYEVFAYRPAENQFACVFLDVTERRQAQETLRQSEEHFRALAEALPQIVWTADAEGGIEWFNRRWYEYTDEQQPVGEGWSWDKVAHPDDMAHTLTNWAEARRTGTLFQNEVRVRRHDGQYRWFLVRAWSLADGDGNIVRWFGTNTDIHDFKLAEEKLQKENREIAISNRILRVFVEETGDDLFDKALQIVLEGMESHHGVFGYVDERDHLMCPSLSKLLAECEVTGKCIDYGPEKWKGLWARALREKRTLFTNESPAVPKGHVPIRNNLAAPILFQDRVIGLLNVANKGTDYTEADCELIEAIANRVAPVLYAWIQRELREDERTTTEQAMRESEQRLRLALEGGRMGRWEWDLSTDSSLWDERTYELLGLKTNHPARIETFLDCVHSQDRTNVKDLIQKSLAERTDFQAEFRVIRPQEAPHDELWLASSCKVICDERNEPIRLIGVLYDVTQRKQMEEQLRHANKHLEEEVRTQTEELRSTVDRLQDEVARRVLAEDKLRKQGRMLEAFFQHTITPLAFMDRDFNFVQVNEAYARADGKEPEFFRGRNHFTLYPHDENKAVFEEVVRTGQIYRAYAKPFNYPSDSSRTTYWDWQLTPLRNERDEVQYLVLNLQDVTQQQVAMDELEHRAYLLQKITLELSQAEDRERKRMAEVLHDGLQQQLAAAKFHLGLLNSRTRNDAAAQEITDQLDKMLRDAIEQSRSLSHELSPAVLYQSDLGETFEWLARMIQTKHGLTVHTEFHGRVDSRSDSIKAFLFRAGQEILFNAVKHAQVDEARLRVQRRGNRLWLTIADKGRGFDPRTLGRPIGFGLLSIRERVELLGGRMKIHSAPGKGSVFLITVPDAEVDNGEDTTRDEAQLVKAEPLPAVVRAPTSGQRLRVLLVDDHKVMREGLAALIQEQNDMEIAGHAGDGSEAVERARELQPDVIIMDVAMPVMAGDEATRRIKAEMPQMRVIALSMFSEPGVREKMLDAGAEVYLPKTGPSEQLLAAIRGPGPA